MTTDLTNIVIEVMPRFEGYVYPKRIGTPSALGFFDCALPVHNGSGCGRFHHGLARQGL